MTHRAGQERSAVPRSLAARLGRAIVVGLAAGLIVAAAAASGLFASLRMQLNDTYFLPRPTSDRIVLVALDDASRTAFGRSVTQWPRTVYADAVAALSRAGARVIAFDVLFTDVADPTGDAALAAALAAARSEYRTRLVMPVVGVLPDRTAAAPGAIAYSDVLRPLPAFTQAVDYLGFVNVLPDSDNAIRHQLSRVRTTDDAADALGYSLAVYLAYQRVPAAAVDQVVVSATDGAAINVGPAVTLPVDASGIWRQNFFRAPLTADAAAPPFPLLSFVDVVQGNFDPAQVADRIVLIGVANSTGSGDRYPVPFARDGRLISGVEIHAHAVETLLQNQPLRVQPLPAAVLTYAAAALLISLLAAFARWYGVLLLMAAGLIGWLVVTSTVFDQQRVIVDLLFGALAIVMPAVIHLVLTGRDEARLRRRSELSLAVVEAILDGSPGAILVLDEALIVRQANTVFRQQIAPVQPGQPFTALLAALDLPAEMAERWLTALRTAAPLTFDLPLAEKTYSVRAAAVATPDGQQDRVILINDVTTLTDLNRLRTQMIRMASHDLKNPLNNILGFAALLQENADDERLSGQVRQFIGYIESSANDMRRIIEGVLNLEKARTGGAAYQRLSLAEVLAEVLTRCRPQAADKNQTLTVTIADVLPDITGDPFQLNQAVFNLVENAIKYTPTGGTVTVTLAERDGWNVLTVTDTGYGIPAEAQSGIFKAFFRAVSGATANIKGTGLGLSLVKTIIDLHGGRIRFTSAEGQGTTFTVELRSLPGAGQPAAVLPRVSEAAHV